MTSHERRDLLLVVLWIIAAFFIAATIGTALVLASPAHARDDGRYADFSNEMHTWFDQLASGKGLCCSFADGQAVTDVDWDTEDGHYRVRLHGQWIVVPDNAVVKEPNKFKRTVVWPYLDSIGNTQIRCFLAGPGA